MSVHQKGCDCLESGCADIDRSHGCTCLPTDVYVTPGHPVMAGAGYNCACGECIYQQKRRGQWPDEDTNGATGLGPMFLPMPDEEAEAQRQRLQAAGTLTPDILRAALDEMSSESRKVPEPEWPLPPAGTDWSDWQVAVLPFYCERCGYRECRRCQGCCCPDQPRTCDACDEEQR